MTELRVFLILASIFGSAFLLLLTVTICELAKGEYKVAILGLIGTTCGGFLIFVLVAHALGLL